MRDLQANQETVPANHITALSVHQAKGLQWPCVILIGASEGILPSKMSKTTEEIDEERRLYYVAVTRAESMLIISPRPGEEWSRFICQ
jgi:DNA helicase-2/ATP-dependent DNA helicase PcrA